MFKHNLKIGWRNILRKKSTSTINIVGLSTAAAVCLLTVIFYRYETSFDHHHELSEHTYRVVQTTQRPDAELYWGTTAYPLAAALRSDFPDFEFVTQTAGPMQRLFGYKNSNSGKVLFEEGHVLFADEYYPQVFDFDWIAGDPATALNEPNAVIITEKVAQKSFGEHFDPSTAIGEVLLLNNKDQLIVKGIIENNRPNINLKANMIVSYEFFKKHNPYPTGNWSGNYQGTTFVVVNNLAQSSEIGRKINDWKKKYLNQDDDEIISYGLQPLPEIHTETKYGATPGGYQIAKSTLDVSLMVAFFILVIAIINFVNLVTANATIRAKEVGVRKALGGGKSIIIGQFVTENALLVGLSFILAIGIAYFSLNYLNDFLQIINLELSFQPSDIAIALAFCVLVILLTTVYPSFILSSFNPTKALYNREAGESKGVGLRKGLTFFQFTIVQVFVIAAIVVGMQLQYFNTKSLGFDSDKVVSIPIPYPEGMDVFMNELKTLNGVGEVSIGSGPPMAVENFALGTRFRLPHQGKNDGLGAEMKIVDSTYLELFHIPLVAGRNIRINKDRFDEFVVSKSLVTSLGWTPEEAIGERLTINEGEATIVGVIDDFHNHSLQNEKTPVVLLNWRAFQWRAMIKVSAFDNLIGIEEKWAQQYPEQIFSYSFVDDSIAKEYVIEQMIYTGFKFFSALVILIAALGIFGLISFLTLQKRKEIGIRRVLGASIAEILVLFNKQFSFLILLAFVTAVPLVWYAMNQWLDSFTYRINLSLWMFVAGGVITFILGSSVAVMKSYRAATLNPAESLKDE